MKVFERYNIFPSSKSFWALCCGGIGGFFYTVGSVIVSPKISIVAFIGTGLILAIFNNPLLGFYSTSFIVPLERFGRITADTSNFTISIMRIVGMASLVGFLLHTFVRKWKIKYPLPIILYSIYTFLAILSVFYSTDPINTVRACGQILSNLLFFFLVINLARNYKTSRTGVVLWLVATMLIAMYTSYDWHFGDRTLKFEDIGKPETRWATSWIDNTEFEANLTQIPRATGSTSHAAVYGINLIIAIPFLCFFMCRATVKKYWKFSAFIVLGVVFYNVLLTNTRAAMLVALIALFFAIISRLLVIRLPYLLLCFILTLAILPKMDFSIFDRILDIKNYTFEKSQTLRIRVEYWKTGMKIVEDNWFAGVGVGNELEVPNSLSKTYLVPKQASVHNDYLQTLMELGLFGWFMQYGTIFLLFRYAFIAARKFRVGPKPQDEQYWFMVATMISMVCVLIYGLQADVFRFPLKAWWLIAGITCTMFEVASAPEKEERRKINEV